MWLVWLIAGVGVAAVCRGGCGYVFGAGVAVSAVLSCFVAFRGNVQTAPPRILGRPLSVISDTDGIGDVCDSIKNQQFRPKARKQDVETYIESCRTKFGCVETENSDNDLAGEMMRSCDSHLMYVCPVSHAGFPPPIQESIKVLREHIYEPLSDYHIKQEDELEKKR